MMFRRWYYRKGGTLSLDMFTHDCILSYQVEYDEDSIQLGAKLII